jgi:hypothetical protein
LNIYLDKFVYDPLPASMGRDEVIKMKNRGISEFTTDPFIIQEKLKLAKRNDRFRQLPALIIGRDKKNPEIIGFYTKSALTQNPLTVDTILRIPTRAYVESELGNSYHIYSPFNKIGKGGLNDKNYSLKILADLVEQLGNSEYLMKYFTFIIKGILISNNISPDYLVTIESSKPINSKIIKLLTSDPYFSKSKVLTIKKVKDSEFFDEYNTKKYDTTEELDNFSNDTKLKMTELTKTSRKVYAKVMGKLLDDKYDFSKITDKNVIFIDDVVTTGSTLSKILIPLFEESNNVLPFAFLLR